MKEGRFPFAPALVLLHTTVGTSLSGLLYVLRPSWFPSLTDPRQKITIDRGLILKGVAPIAVFFSVQLVLSNSAYMHLSVAFLQMMKEANIVLVYFFSLLAALEIFSWRHLWILCCVMLATMLTIHGELHFSLKGFVIQSIGQVFESCRIVLQAALLSGAGRNFDPLTYQLLVSPVCFLGLAFFVGIAGFAGESMHKLAFPPISIVVDWWPVLLANCVVAFSLNLAIALFMKKSSAVSFVLAGIFKDCSIVLVSAVFIHEEVSKAQALGFSAQLCFILVWSLMKKFPKDFDEGIIQGFTRVLIGSLSDQKAAIKQKDSENYGATDSVPELACVQKSEKALEPECTNR